MKGVLRPWLCCEPPRRATSVRSSSPTALCCARRKCRTIPAWAELRAASREFLTPWEPLWSTDELSRASFRRRVRHYLRDLREDVGYALFIFAATSGALVGGLTLCNVRRGRHAVLHARLLGRRHICPPGLYDGRRPRRHPFRVRFARAAPARSGVPVRPMRPRSSCWRRPVSSARVSRAAILRINGVWQDHLLYALLDTDPRR